MKDMNLKDIRIKRTEYKQRKKFLWINYTKTIWVKNVLEGNYNGEWINISVFVEDKFV